jgi:hypothetical protein
LNTDTYIKYESIQTCPTEAEKRENAGRPAGQGKYGESTVTMRIPQSQTATIKSFLE